MQPQVGASAGYPSAADLVTSSGEWRRWLDEALRAVLTPVAVASAIGIAAAGCGSGVATPPGIVIGEGSSPASGTPGASAVLLPLGVAKPGTASGGKPGAGAMGVTLASLGIATTAQGQSTPPTIAPQNLNNVPSHSRPIQHPIAMPGRIAMPQLAHPVPPPPAQNPPAMRGEPPAVQAVRPAPAPRRVAPIRPDPSPPRLSGDEANVDPVF